MKWTELVIYTSQEGIEPVTGLLINLGVTSFAVEDPLETKEFIKESSSKWDIIDSLVTEVLDELVPNIKVYIPDNPQGDKLHKDLCAAVAEMKTNDTQDIYGSLNIGVTLMDDADWENNWKIYFKPFTVGSKLAVCPTWEEYDNPEKRIVLKIDPASSFGSGLHESTRLCLVALEKYVKGGNSLIDVGCGSGILSVAAAKLGCESVLALDIDENAVETTKNTVEVNNETQRVKVISSDLLSKVTDKADIVVANIFASVIVKLALEIKNALKPEGIFISSGIIKESLEDVLNAFKANGIEILEVNNDGQWYAVIGKYHNN